MLLFAGLRLCFSGALAHGGARDDEINYTRRLFGLVRSYSPWARTLGASRLHPRIHAVPWLVYKCYGEANCEPYGQEASLQEGPPPPLHVTAAELGIDAKGFFPRDDAAEVGLCARDDDAAADAGGRP